MTPLADSGISDRLVKLHPALLIDQTCFEFIDINYSEAVKYVRIV